MYFIHATSFPIKLKREPIYFLLFETYNLEQQFLITDFYNKVLHMPLIVFFKSNIKQK